MRLLRPRAAVIVPLAACSIVLAACGGSPTPAPDSSPSSAGSSTSGDIGAVVGSLTGTFSATVLQGPEAGTAYQGEIKLDASETGYLTGTLTTPGGSVPVTGQIHGQLIGLSLAVGPGKTVSGTGVVGYEPATKANTIAGTFSGPSDTSTGVWDYTVSPTSAGGCLIGLPYQDRRPGVGILCRVIS